MPMMNLKTKFGRENLKIISLINSKGGVGKTTLCINLAREMLLHLCAKEEKPKDAKVLLVDADPQGSIRDWHEAGGHVILDMIAMDRMQAIASLRTTNLSYDYVFIDTPGKVGEIMASAIAISDLILVPVQPSPYDIWATADTIELVKNRQALAANGTPKAQFVLNRCIPNTNISADAKEYLHKSIFPHLHTSICNRVIFAESANRGCTVFESGNQMAIDSILSLGKEVRGVLENA
jgi:chromosome partitioning protein